MRITRISWLFASVCLLSIQAAPESSYNCEVSVDGSCEQSQPECSLYMAESTIPGSGLGIFTGVERHVNETVGTGDVMFPLVDVAYHMQVLGTKILHHPDIVTNPTMHYIWFGPEMGMQQETAHPYVQVEFVSAFAPGLDAAINCHLGLPNVDKTMPIYDTAGLHRSRDPGAGGFTPYHKCKTYVTHPIPAGGELFKFYGDGWFEGRLDEFGLIPLSEDYPDAEKLVRDFDVFMNRLRQYNNVKWSESIQWDLWDIIVNSNLPSRMVNALPKTWDDFNTVLTENIRAIYQPAATKSLTELDQMGRCLDYTESGPSTILQAGRGSFATRFLPKGTVVASSPLLFVPNDEFFQMYEGNWFQKDDIPNRNKVVHHQIMYNYCWHHNASSIFLCPYGVGINYINHGSSNTTANARLQWAKDGEMGHNETLLHRSPREMMNHPAPGLYLDVVATRDIQPLEEILYDYGPAWQAAWEKHAVEWDTAQYSPSYQSARDWSMENPDAILRTEKEQEIEPYPSHFELKCLMEIDYYSFTPKEAREKWQQDNYPGNPCRIMERKKNEGNTEEYLYKVLYKEQEHIDVSEQTLTSLDDQEWIESPWIVREALRFVDVAYSTDLWLPGAFRHPIGFPDDIFPDAWRETYLSFNVS